MGPWAIVLAVGLFGSIVTTTVVGGIIHSFTRETTGMNERWLERTMEERDILVGRLAGLNIFANVSDNPDQSPSDPNGDADGDGLSNGIENGSLLFGGADNPGTEAKNPDTDGDGVADGTEVDQGTDPTDGESGGLDTPPIIGETVSGRSVVIIDQVSKTVGGQHRIETAVGGTVTFHIHVQATKYGRARKFLRIVDRLPAGMAFESGRIESTLGDTDLTGWTGSQEYSLLHPGTYVFDIYLTARMNTAGNFENVVSVFDTEFPQNSIEDTVYIVVREGGLFYETPELVHISKEGKRSGGRTWNKHVFAKPGDTLVFRLNALTGDLKANSDVRLQDTLPRELTYSSGTARLLINGREQDIDPTTLASQVLGAGYLLRAANSNYEITFSAKLDASPTFDISNYLNGFLNGSAVRQSYARITPRP